MTFTRAQTSKLKAAFDDLQVRIDTAASTTPDTLTFTELTVGFFQNDNSVAALVTGPVVLRGFILVNRAGGGVNNGLNDGPGGAAVTKLHTATPISETTRVMFPDGLRFTTDIRRNATSGPADLTFFYTSG